MVLFIDELVILLLIFLINKVILFIPCYFPFSFILISQYKCINLNILVMIPIK